MPRIHAAVVYGGCGALSKRKQPSGCFWGRRLFTDGLTDKRQLRHGPRPNPQRGQTRRQADCCPLRLVPSDERSAGPRLAS